MKGAGVLSGMLLTCSISSYRSQSPSDLSACLIHKYCVKCRKTTGQLMYQDDNLKLICSYLFESKVINRSYL